MAQPPQESQEKQHDWVNAQRLTELLYDLIDQEGEAAFEHHTLVPGDILFKQGDEADSMYLLQAGVLGVRVKHPDGQVVDIARLAPGAVVGEMALLSGSKRSATVFAVNDVGLLRLTQDQFLQLMEADQTALAEMSATAIPRWQRQQISQALRTLLGEVDAAALDALQEQLVWHYYANGAVIFEQGEPSDGMYIVVNGRLRTMVTQGDGTVMDLGTIGPGEPVGEMGVITAAPRSATVHTVRESHLVKLTTLKFKRLIRQYPDLMINITRVIIERQQRLMEGTLQERIQGKNLVIIPGRLSLDAPRFAQALSLSLAPHGATLILDSDGFDAKYGEPLASQTEPDDIGHTAIVAWLSELDADEEFVLYVADPFPSAWTSRCINHADIALVLADPAADPHPGDAEQMLDELVIPVHRELVFLHTTAPESLPDISPWLALRPSAGHHFLVPGDQESMDRLAAILA